MSYARWSHSNWYAFDNCNGLFSLWYVGEDDYRDWDYDTLREQRDAGTLDQWLQGKYPNASADDRAEAVQIIGRALEDEVPT
ncbi:MULTISPECIES: hypothetical protein [unclassified Cupriavidus]|uniref:hypothetical protein n=1 Tax=unclassified Cupriavidus TaxID=2640874 RepID=UPI001C001A66|nr:MULTISPECIES: hypothetical protein [unclassified Cupriavidus]MCA3183241.1 hypothetical protein [Cupriavidus sp.]MCA3194337.1 hypothetical protein [Cupriavidus sp.]MCA3200445.1 hypothetical protein [Cupriavidus sp.]MCA3231167.1 hypothetical protein [Cupriavidus sp.]QWE95321.1 hypothetical protein KLP38_05310 [Cupriavidus sp. EM10]